MKPSLQLRLSQHLTLTPQLQLSIRLLQLSTQELDQEIEGFLRDNPLLERDEAMSDMTDSTAPAPLPPRTEYEQEQAAAPASDASSGATDTDAPANPLRHRQVGLGGLHRLHGGQHFGRERRATPGLEAHVEHELLLGGEQLAVEIGRAHV